MVHASLDEEDQAQQMFLNGPAVRAARRDPVLRDFLQKVQTSDGFWRAVRSLSKSCGMPENDLLSFAEELCHCCYTQADAVVAGDGKLAAATGEIDRLKSKLNQCNLSALKQTEALKAGTHFSYDLEDDTITFHEPLQYLDQGTKELVLSIVSDKVRLLESGHAPASLIEALTGHSHMPAQAGGDTRVEELAEELEDARNLLTDVRGRLNVAEQDATRAKKALLEAETKAEKMRVALEAELAETREQQAAAEAKAAKAEKALQDLQEREAALRKAFKELQIISAEQKDEIERQQKEVSRQKQVILSQERELQKQQEEIQRQRSEIERVRQELEQERQANAKVRAELEGERQANAKLQQQVEQFQQHLEALQARYDALEKEANSMREELARRDRTTTQGTQTTLTASKLDEQADERKQLKVMLEELQTKLKELMEKCRSKGIGDSVAAIAQELGLQDVLKEKTVFQRLYDDAMNRVQRLERLRDKVKKERQGLGSVEEEPKAEASVYESVGQSKISSAQKKLAKPRSQKCEASTGSLVPTSVTNVPFPTTGLPSRPALWATMRPDLDYGVINPSESEDEICPFGAAVRSPHRAAQPLSPQREMRGSASLPALSSQAVQAGAVVTAGSFGMSRPAQRLRCR